MTLEEILGSDVRQIGALIGRGFSWWIGQLAALAPPGLRADLARPRLMARREASGEWRFWRSDRPQRALPRPRPGTRVQLVLGAHQVLERELALPPLPRRDLRRMVALDLDRLSPLRGELVYFDLDIGTSRGDGRAPVRLGILPRSEAARAVAEARQAGLEPASLVFGPPRAGAPARFDFLPSLRRAHGGGAGAVRILWAAAAGLAAVNLGVLVGRDIVHTDRLRALVAARRPLVLSVERVRSTVQTEEARRTALLARRSAHEPLAMLDAVSLALPQRAWVQHLEWNGDTLRLVGFAAPQIDLAAALRGSHVFTNPRSLTTGPPPQLANGAPFDITADARTGA